MAEFKAICERRFVASSSVKHAEFPRSLIRGNVISGSLRVLTDDNRAKRCHRWLLNLVQTCYIIAHTDDAA